jgi:hypothetical protein
MSAESAPTKQFYPVRPASSPLLHPSQASAGFCGTDRLNSSADEGVGDPVEATAQPGDAVDSRGVVREDGTPP